MCCPALQNMEIALNFCSFKPGSSRIPQWTERAHGKLQLQRPQQLSLQHKLQRLSNGLIYPLIFECGVCSKRDQELHNAWPLLLCSNHQRRLTLLTQNPTVRYWDYLNLLTLSICLCISRSARCVGMLQSCNQGHMTFRRACSIQSWHCTMWQRYSECTLSRCSSSIVGLPCVCDTFHGRMHTCRNSLHHLERWDLRHENAEGPQLPFLCLHHRNSPPSAVVVCPADILFSN